MSVQSGTKKTYLNVGCGHRFYRGEPWINFDVVPCDSSVILWDARVGFSMGANTVDVVYLSHVLEHFTEETGARLIAECYRVLKPSGFLRVVVPDLEGICREYLRLLDEIRATPPGHPGYLDWIKLELLDQCTRQESGGRMRTFFRDHGRDSIEYVVGRIGTVGLQLARKCFPSAEEEQAKLPRRPAFINWLGRLKGRSPRAWLLKALLTKGEAEALRIGRFRTGGEVHLWMYELEALERLLKGVGFASVEFHNADTSQIADWGHYHLDTDTDGREHAPHSLYAEGRKRPL